MPIDQLTPSSAIRLAVTEFEATWTTMFDSENEGDHPRFYEAGCGAWDRLMKTPCSNMADVCAKAAAFTVYREGATDWAFDTLNDDDFPHLASLFADAARISQSFTGR